MVAKVNKVRPSEILGIDNDYEAFCFDEACAYISEEYSKAQKEKRKVYWVEQYQPAEAKPSNNADLFKELSM